ncbi:hypothetical protein [Pseudomonas syringae]|uniref:hypothetical protein n=1 Tax=Pseudomonas syringae TaxID=317 RepID=UPI001372D582|nr:hypothetical protein [Pseudomonas syringae]NAT26111.1 hypothetical protein [Pseudomonas syringae pv. actinidifoliorum]NAT36598.1 hypothetical protein [Pseudomonas syringae pv. actinidifoliorum]
MRFEYSESDGLSIFKNARLRSTLRKKLGGDYKTFPKTQFSKNSTDVFSGAAVKVWYEADDEVKGVQLYHPEAEFYYFGKQLLGNKVEELELFFFAIGQPLIADDDGTGFSTINETIRFYVPDFYEFQKKACVECVHVDIPKI